MSGIWRRIRGALKGRPAGGRPEALPNLPFIEDKARPAPAPPPPSPAPEQGPPSAELGQPPAPVAPAPAPPPEPAVAPPSVEQLAESLSNRLAEDEALRGSLSDEEFQPLLDWAMARISELARSCASLPPEVAAVRFNQASSQLLNLLRTVDLAIGQRAGTGPDLVVSRFQMLDTLLQPPLLDQVAARRARARLEALLALPGKRLQAADGAKLARQLAEALE